MNSEHLIEIAIKLATGEGTKPRQAELRRAISTAYYGMFHSACKTYVDILAGTSPSDRNNIAWIQAYRSLSHHQILSCCTRKDIQQDFPPAIRKFCREFSSLQLMRFTADYNPDETFYRSLVLKDIRKAENAIIDFNSAKLSDRKAFVTFASTIRRKS
ncbi:MAG: hypothetical protein OXF06_14755 [Bacteroidetes bacterium]|nr:hypothetical protein [Bacteroidota bacterium]